MTRKDYEAIAKALRAAGTVTDAISNIADVMAQDNPRFDRKRFIGACA